MSPDRRSITAYRNLPKFTVLYSTAAQYDAT